MATTNFSTSLGRYIKTVKEFLIEKKYFFGIVTVNEVVKTETLSIDLDIIAADNFDKVFVNGEEYIKK